MGNIVENEHSQERENLENLARMCILVWRACAIEAMAATSAARVEFVYKYTSQFQKLLAHVLGRTFRRVSLSNARMFWRAWHEEASELAILRRVTHIPAFVQLAHRHSSSVVRVAFHSWHN